MFPHSAAEIVCLPNVSKCTKGVPNAVFARTLGRQVSSIRRSMLRYRCSTTICALLGI